MTALESTGAAGARTAKAALAREASTPHERLLVAKLMEASSILTEQDATLKMALAALAAGDARPRGDGADAGGGPGS